MQPVIKHLNLDYQNHHVLRCRDAIKRSIAYAQFDSFSLFWYILAQYIIPYFKADISSFPTGDRWKQISLYISLLHHDWQSRVAKLKIKKNRLNICCIYSHQLRQQLAHDKVQDRNIVYLPILAGIRTDQQHKKKKQNKIRSGKTMV